MNTTLISTHSDLLKCLNLITHVKNIPFYIKILLFFCGLFFSEQVLAVTYNFSDTGTGGLSGCSRTGAGTYTCTSAVTLTGNDSITISGTIPATITFNSNLTLQFLNETTQAKINLAGSASNLRLIVNGTLNMGKKTVVNANVRANSISDTGGNVTFGGNIETSTGNILLGYESEVLGGIISTTGSITFGDRAKASGTVSSTSGAITLNGNNTLSSTVSCTSCTMDVKNAASTVNGAINVNYFDDTSNGSNYQSNITATSTSGKSAFIIIGDAATVTGNVNAYSSFANNAQVRIKNGATVNGNIGSYASGASSVTDTYIYLESNATVNGNVTANSTGSNQYTRVETLGTGVTINGSVSAIAATASYGTVYLRAGLVTGDVISSDDLYNYANIGGCAQTYSPSLTNSKVHLYSGSMTNATCRGISTCSSDLRYVDKHSSIVMPPICSKNATLIAEYHLDEVAFNGTANETKDSAGYSGGPFHGQGIGSPIASTSNAAPAKAGTTGTCGYALLSPNPSTGTTNASAFTLDGLPVSTVTGNITSVSFWMYWDGTNVVMPIGWAKYDLIFLDGHFGFNTANADVYGMSSSGLANRWVHVVAEFANGSVINNKLYIDNVQQTITQRTGSPLTGFAVVQSTLQVSGWTNPSNNTLDYRFANGRIDEVKVYNGAMTQAQVLADFTEVHNCNRPSLVAEYRMDELSWNGSANDALDSSGNNYHGQAIGSSTLPITAQSNRANANSPGTCGYGDFTGGSKAVRLPATFPKLKDNLTITAWVRLNNFSPGIPRIFIDGETATANGGYAFKIDGRKVSFFKNAAVGTNNVNVFSDTLLNANQWYFVAAAMNNVTDSVTIYIYNQSGTLIESKVGGGYTDTFTNVAVSPTLRASIGGQPGFLNTLNGLIDEVRVYDGTLYQSEIFSIFNTTRTCPSYATNATPNRFNCIAEQETNVNTGKLYTQLANTSFNIKVIALKTDGTAETSFSAASDRTAVLRFKNQVSNTLINFSGGETANSKNVLFTTANNTGIVTVTGITIPQSYKNLRCEVSEGAVSASPSSDNFSVKPAFFSIIGDAGDVSADWNGVSTTATPTHIAGSNFSLFLIADKSYGVIDDGYNGQPTINASAISAHAGANVIGTIAGTFPTAANGTSTGTNFTYSEVGYFSFNINGVIDTSFTAVDQSGDCVLNSASYTRNGSGLYGCNIGNADPTEFFGRFIPDHLAITSSMSTNACGAFNYYGQDGVSTTFVLSAQNNSNAVTQNYTGAFAKLPLNAWSATTGFRFVATGLTSGTLSSGASPPTGSWANGVTTVTAMHQVARLATPMNPATISITAQPIDSDGVTTPIATLDSNIPFRYGRLTLRNAYGSELLPLTIPIEAQYWDGTTYRRNTLDSCTNTTTANMTLSNYKKNLNAGETTLSGGGLMNEGKSSFTLSKPGAGNSGSVDLSFSLTNFPWMGSGNLAARATFGLYKSPIIYMRENY